MVLKEYHLAAVCQWSGFFVFVVVVVVMIRCPMTFFSCYVVILVYVGSASLRTLLQAALN